MHGYKKGLAWKKRKIARYNELQRFRCSLHSGSSRFLRYLGNPLTSSWQTGANTVTSFEINPRGPSFFIESLFQVFTNRKGLAHARTTQKAQIQFANRAKNTSIFSIIEVGLEKSRKSTLSFLKGEFVSKESYFGVLSWHQRLGDSRPSIWVTLQSQSNLQLMDFLFILWILKYPITVFVPVKISRAVVFSLRRAGERSRRHSPFAAGCSEHLRDMFLDMIWMLGNEILQTIYATICRTTSTIDIVSATSCPTTTPLRQNMRERIVVVPWMTTRSYRSY